MALAGVDEKRVGVTSLEPAEFGAETVAGLAQLVSELIGNGIEFSAPDDRVSVAGVFDRDQYVISISDRGVGIPGHLIEGLNQMLARPGDHGASGPRLGIALVAMLAARHGIGVRLVPGVPGTTARVTVPAELVAPPGTDSKAGPRTAAPDMGGLTVDLSTTAPAPRAKPRSSREDAEVFLERVFSSLTRQPSIATAPPAGPRNGVGNGRSEERPATVPGSLHSTVSLRRRVPGESFTPVEDDQSTVAAEKAIDIRSALSRYTEGRLTAERHSEAS